MSKKCLNIKFNAFFSGAVRKSCFFDFALDGFNRLLYISTVKIGIYRLVHQELILLYDEV